MGFNISEHLKQQIGQISKAGWEHENVHYLDIRSSEDFAAMTQINLVPIINSVKNTFTNWTKLKLSWMGRIAAVKMKILLRFLFVFQNMIIRVLRMLLQQVQNMMNEFKWNGKNPELRSVLQKEVKREELAVLLCYLAVIVPRWMPSSEINWMVEQLDVPVLLSEWILLRPQDRVRFKGSGSYSYRTLKTWAKYRLDRVTSQPLVRSFIYHLVDCKH